MQHLGRLVLFTRYPFSPRVLGNFRGLPHLRHTFVYQRCAGYSRYRTQNRAVCFWDFLMRFLMCSGCSTSCSVHRAFCSPFSVLSQTMLLSLQNFSLVKDDKLPCHRAPWVRCWRLIFAALACKSTLSVGLFSSEPVSHSGRSGWMLPPCWRWLGSTRASKRPNCLPFSARNPHTCWHQTMTSMVKFLAWCTWGIWWPSINKLQV